MDNMAPILLNDIKVVDMSFCLDESNPESQDEFDVKPQFEIRQYDHQGAKDDEPCVCKTEVKCSVFCDLPKGERPFTASVTMYGIFTVNDMKNKDQLMKYNAVATLLPYIRSALTCLTSISEMPPLKIPLISVMDMYKE